MKFHPYRFYLVLLLVLLTTLACRLNVGGPENPSPISPDPMETEESIIEPEIIKTLESSSPEESITLTFTEAQLTDLIAAELANQTDPILHDPQVVLSDGRIELYGRVTQGFLSGNAHISITAVVDGQGNPRFDITSATIGPLPVPDAILKQFSTALDEGLTGKLGPKATGIRIEEIQIESGKMTVSGMRE